VQRLDGGQRLPEIQVKGRRQGLGQVAFLLARAHCGTIKKTPRSQQGLIARFSPSAGKK
jgi:hypothetical protein